jgi:hypothetical protein
MKARIPPKTKSSKTDSNRRHAKLLLEKERRAIRARNKPYRKARAAFMRARKAALTPEAIKNAKPLLDSRRREFAQAALPLDGDADAVADAKAQTRKSLDRALSRAIPAYKRYRTARDVYLKKLSVLSGKAAAVPRPERLVADIGDNVFTDDPDAQSFGPPYELYDVSTLDLGYPGDMITHNGSFVEPQNGILFNDIRFRHSEDSWFVSYNPRAEAWTRVAAGVNYRVPATGYLKGGIVLRNLYNHFSYAVTDNFGFSHAYLTVSQSIFIDIVRSGEVTRFSKVMANNGLESLGGTELSHAESPIPTFTPITFGFTTRDAFLKGENIQIFAGSEIYLGSDLDDMNSFGEATLAWQLLSFFLCV